MRVIAGTSSFTFLTHSVRLCKTPHRPVVDRASKRGRCGVPTLGAKHETPGYLSRKLRRIAMGAFVDFSGRVFGKWTVLYRGENKRTITQWMCRCSCGTEKLVQAAHLKTGASTCCGWVKPNARTHGAASLQYVQRFPKKYRTWRQMRSRCCNPNHKNASIYNGLLCEAWHEYATFDSDVPDPPSDKHTIDRIDNTKGYEPGNVRWVTTAEQHRNQSNCRWIEFDGRTQLLTDWAKELGITDSTLHGRIKKWGIQQALSR